MPDSPILLIKQEGTDLGTTLDRDLASLRHGWHVAENYEQLWID